MAVLHIRRISICALKKDRKAILEKLQSMGVMEISQVLEPDEDFQWMDTANAKSSFEKAAMSADRALDILKEYAPKKESMLSSLAGKDLIEQEEYQQIIKERDSLLRTANQIQALYKEHAENTSEILKLENTIESLTPWMNLDIPMNLKGTLRTAVLIGSMPGTMTLEGIYEVLAEKAPETEGVDVHIISSAQEAVYLVAVCLKEDLAQVEDALRSRGFARPSVVQDKVPAQAKADLEAQIAACREKLADIEEQIRRQDVNRTKLQILADYYRIRAEKYGVLGQIPQSDRTFLISGYVPEKKVEALRKVFEEHYDCVLDVEELKEDEEAPVLLENNRFAQSGEGILSSFGLPAKGEIDPTAIMTVFYVFLFGLMLSDAAYGAIVSIACGAVLLKFPRMESGMRKSIQLFFWCGLSTLFWGVMFGGYFGDVINVVSRTFFGHEITIKPVWFAPLDDPMKLLVYSMLFGIIHLFTGLGIKGYLCLKDKKYMDFFCDVVLWFALLIGLLIMLIPSELFRSISQMDIVFPAFVNMLGRVFAIFGAVGILFMSGRDKKNIGLRLALGAYDLYNISGWLSDVLSYSRLLALGLATGVIASVVNQMGSMGGKSVFGVILFIIVFIVGHIFNLALNLLGAYVHTNRLQYVEFFGKFYEGGGREFHPFRENTKYADIKEEN